MNPWLVLLVSWPVMSAVMLGLWRWQRSSGRASVVDVAWSFGVGLIGIVTALQAAVWKPRGLLVASLIGVWSLRLGFMLLGRIRSLPEDGRYGRLLEQWGSEAQKKLLHFFLLQAAWTPLFAIPCLLAARRPEASWELWDFIGVALAVIAILGEFVADRQLNAFRKDPAHRGQVCRRGLWRYSRHPNYFFEWIHWWAYVAIAGGSDALFALAGPALMLLFLYRVTGIPHNERQALESRPVTYRQYQKTTSAFFPWFPSRSSS